jgi:hypothetical protein
LSIFWVVRLPFAIAICFLPPNPRPSSISISPAKGDSIPACTHKPPRGKRDQRYILWQRPLNPLPSVRLDRGVCYPVSAAPVFRPSLPLCLLVACPTRQSAPASGAQPEPALELGAVLRPYTFRGPKGRRQNCSGILPALVGLPLGLALKEVADDGIAVPKFNPLSAPPIMTPMPVVMPLMSSQCEH